MSKKPEEPKKDRPPRNRDPERRVRFVLHAVEELDPAKLRSCVEAALVKECGSLFPRALEWTEEDWKRDRPSPRSGRGRTRKEEKKGKERPGKPGGRLPVRLEAVEIPSRDLDKRYTKTLLQNRFWTLTLPEFETEFRRRHCKPNAHMYDAAYRLKRACGLSGVYPDLQYPGYTALSSLTGGACPAAAVANWQLPNIGIGAVPAGINGATVTIGHPDTGWTAHGELNFLPVGGAAAASANFNLAADVNVVAPASGSAREAVPPFRFPGLFPHHGTRTASMIISAAGFAPGGDSVTGVAPGATIVSIRCVDTVVLISATGVALAILAAVAAGVQVISISLGGYPNPFVRFAIKLAVASNILVVAAAGQVWPVVVYPAAYPECVAVTAHDVTNIVMSDAARDWLRPPRINISAPGVCITNAMWSPTPAPPLPETPTTNLANGTSFSTAIVAGAAALWLQFFGRAALIASLGGRAPLQALFQTHLRATAVPPAGWNTFLDGPGILSLAGLLNPATLPPPGTFELPFWLRGILTPPGISGAVGTRTPLPGAPDTGGPPEWMERIFRGEAGEVLQEAAEEVASIVMSNTVIAGAVVATQQAIDAAAEAAQAAADAAGNAASEVVETLEEAAETAQEAVEDTAETAADFISEAASDGLNTIAGWFGG